LDIEKRGNGKLDEGRERLEGEEPEKGEGKKVGGSHMERKEGIKRGQEEAG
jgi:hypothetical protein